MWDLDGVDNFLQLLLFVEIDVYMIWWDVEIHIVAQRWAWTNDCAFAGGVLGGVDSFSVIITEYFSYFLSRCFLCEDHACNLLNSDGVDVRISISVGVWIIID